MTKPTYTVLTTFPVNRSSANVGDQLIEVAFKRLLEKELGEVDFLTIFREDSLEDQLEKINATTAALMPGFPIRDTPMYPGCYRLVENLDRIAPPLIPIGANWNVYPGDATSRRNTRYSTATNAFLQRVANGVKNFSCREYYVCDMLHKHGITNTLMTGDPAWYDPDFLGKPLHRPTTIKRLVFSPPLSAFYQEQAEEILAMLADLFPQAQRYCAMHLADVKVSRFADKAPTNDASMRVDVADKNAAIRRRASDLGFEVLELSGNVEKLDIYRDCDLHVGYECHAHLSFFRQRRPSVLIAEDARGVGFNYTLGVGGFSGFIRQDRDPAPTQEGGTSGYCVTAQEYQAAPARPGLADDVRRYIEQECESGFRRYLGLTEFIDETYQQAMAPFLKTLPA